MRLPVLLMTALLILPAAHAAKGHVHGEGRLDIVIDQDQLMLDLELPLDAAVGFEHAPKSEKEKAALAAAENALREGALLFQPNPAANCALQSAQVIQPKTERGHADLTANYVFRCANPARLKSLETTLFKQFKRLYRIEAQRSGPAGQGAARLVPKKPHLNW